MMHVPGFFPFLFNLVLLSSDYPSAPVRTCVQVVCMALEPVRCQRVCRTMQRLDFVLLALLAVFTCEIMTTSTGLPT